MASDADEGPTVFVTVPGLVAAVEEAAARLPLYMCLPPTSDPAQAEISGSPLDGARSTDMCIPYQPLPVPRPLQYRPNLSLEPTDMDPMDLNNRRRLVPDVTITTTDEGSRDDLSMRANWNMGCKYCCKWAIAFRESKYMIPVQVLFLIVMMYTAYVGGSGINNCRMSPYVPMLICQLGSSGSILVVCQIAMLHRKIHTEGQLADYILSGLIICGYFLVFISLFTEMACFFGKTPSFDPKDVDYCEETLYKYAHWTNWCGLFFVLLLTVLNLPRKFVYTFMDLMDFLVFYHRSRSR